MRDVAALLMALIGLALLSQTWTNSRGSLCAEAAPGGWVAIEYCGTPALRPPR